MATTPTYWVWRMSAARCAELTRNLRQAEVALHAHVLSEPPPAPLTLPSKGPLSKSENQEGDPKAAQTTAINASESFDPHNRLAEEAKEKLVRHILQLVADNTGFLVEDRLFSLIAKYQLSARNLCTLDAIFMALEIQAEEDIELLCKTFLNYAFCPICIGMEVMSEQMDLSTTSQDDTHAGSSQHMSVGTKGARGDRMSMRGRPSIARSISASTSRSAHIGFRGHELSPDDQQLMTEAEEILQKCGDPRADILMTGGTAETGGASAARRAGGRGVTVASKTQAGAKKTNLFLCPIGHNLEIEAMQVLTALGEFISVFVPPEKKKLYDLLDSVKPPDFTTASRKLKSEEIEQYWLQWKNVFPPEKGRFWEGLLIGLNNYLPILQERERVHNEVVLLRRRNAALRRLMRGALPEIPPQQPQYLRPYPPAFTAPYPDEAPQHFAKLPPI